MEKKTLGKTLVRTSSLNRTPKSMNQTLRNTTIVKQTQTKRFGNISHSHPNLNCTAAPKIKSALFLVEAPCDWDLECGLDYDEYLIATFEEEELQKMAEIHTQDCKDQLQIHLDILHNLKTDIRKKEAEIRNVEDLKIADQKLDLLQGHCDRYVNVCEDHEFVQLLHLLVSMLKPMANQIHLKNMKAIEDPASYNRLIGVLQRIMSVNERLITRNDIEDVCSFGGSVKNAEIHKRKLFELISSFKMLEKRWSLKLLKEISDYFAKQGRYESSAKM